MKTTVSGHTSSISALTGRVNSLETASDAQAGNLSSLQNTVSTQGKNISTLQSTTGTHTSQISALQDAVESLQEGGGIPAGVIALYNSTTPPTGFAVCDGTGGTPKLTGYTAGNLRYIRKS